MLSIILKNVTNFISRYGSGDALQYHWKVHSTTMCISTFSIKEDYAPGTLFSSWVSGLKQQPNANYATDIHLHSISCNLDIQDPSVLPSTSGREKTMNNLTTVSGVIDEDNVDINPNGFHGFCKVGFQARSAHLQCTNSHSCHYYSSKRPKTDHPLYKKAKQEHKERYTCDPFVQKCNLNTPSQRKWKIYRQYSIHPW